MAKSTPPKSCFVVGPIGNNDSDVRKFADWLLRGIIEPVLEGEFGYEVKRADEMIPLSSQTHVPNVFENALELWLWRPAHGSIRVHEGEPIKTGA